MKNFVRSLLVLMAFHSYSYIATAQGYLRAHGTAIVNEQGDSIILRGMGLGGWMLQEGYMLQTSAFANAQYQIKEKIEDLIGKEDSDQFYQLWLENHVRKIDIDSLKSWGFNSVRLPMHYNLYTLPIEEEPVPGKHTWLDKGFQLTDSLIAWCKQNQMYVILDLHAAPGGQGYDQGISDYDPTKPSLWESKANRDKTVALWQKLAERYVDEPWVGGYDLINETNWNMTGNSPLRDLYYELTDSIRAIDPHHIIFIEGNWFANDFTGLTPPWDDNLVYSPHKYWSTNDQNSIQWVLDIRKNHNVPIYFGESGENSNVWFRDAIRLLEDHDIGWAWWPMKKVESISGPLSLPKSTGYQNLLDYWNGSGTRPSAAAAKASLMQLAEGMKLENCVFHKDVIDAMFRQVYSDQPLPYRIQDIPGVVYPTEYDMGVIGSAYFDNEAANYHVSTGHYTSWNNGWIYRNDGVDIEPSEDNTNTNGYGIGWLATDEWMQYSTRVNTEGIYDVEVRVASTSTDGRFHFQSGSADLSGVVNVRNTGGWQNWETVTARNVILSETDQKIRFYVDQEGYNLGGFKFIYKGSSTSLETQFLSAFTLDEKTIQLNLNKPLKGPLPASPAGFQIYVNGNAVSVSEMGMDPQNSRIIRFVLGTGIEAGNQLWMSYTSDKIEASDGTLLTTFFNKLVRNNVALIHEIPGRVEAEDFFHQSGIQLENTTDAGGGQNIGYLDKADYVDYHINVSQGGTYRVDYRTAAQSETGAVKLELIAPSGAAEFLHEVDFAPTGGWQDWATTGKTLILPAGKHHLRLSILEPLFNINWLDFELLWPTSTESSEGLSGMEIYPNPAQDYVALQGTFTEAGDVEIQIYDMLGHRIFTRQLHHVTQLDQTIHISQWPEGMYCLTLQLEDGSILSENFIKLSD